MENESPLWRLILNERGPSFNEINDASIWNLYKVYEFNALLDMQGDQAAAVQQHYEDEQNTPDKGF